jgi:hypothetical protein
LRNGNGHCSQEDQFDQLAWDSSIHGLNARHTTLATSGMLSAM